MTWWTRSSENENKTNAWKIVIGLGNPGRKYSGTRHNVGFEVVERLAEKYAVRSKEKFSGEWFEFAVGEFRVGLLRPWTFMNLSGRSAREVSRFYQLPLANLLVVCDDFNLELGRLRWRSSGSAGGQKGLADILQQLGTDQVSRARIGVGIPPPGWNRSDFVLGRFSEDEIGVIRPAIQRTADGTEAWIQHGIEHCMNQYNAKSTE